MLATNVVPHSIHSLDFMTSLKFGPEGNEFTPVDLFLSEFTSPARGFEPPRSEVRLADVG